MIHRIIEAEEAEDHEEFENLDARLIILNAAEMTTQEVSANSFRRASGRRYIIETLTAKIRT